MGCAVLRCDRPLGKAYEPKIEPHGQRIERIVCQEHGARIEAGDPWLFDGTDNVIYMDADLDATGLRLIESASSSSNMDALNGVEPLIRLQLGLAKFGRAADEEATLLLRRRDAQAVVALLRDHLEGEDL
jgi:hypothetical protein